MICIQTPARTSRWTDFVVRTDPRQPLGMGQNWNVVSHQETEEQVFQARGGNVMRWLDKDVACIAQGQQMTGMQLRHEIRHDVVIGASDQP